MVRSDPRSELRGGEGRVAQNWQYKNLQVKDGHGTRQLLHIIYTDRGGDTVHEPAV